MTRYIPATEVAKMIRTELKKEFKGVKFNVTSNSFSGGSSIDVSWVDGPREDLVSKIVKRYQSSHYNPNADIWETSHDEQDGEEICYLSKYVSTKREYSEGFLRRIIDYVEAQNLNWESSEPQFSIGHSSYTYKQRVYESWYIKQGNQSSRFGVQYASHLVSRICQMYDEGEIPEPGFNPHFYWFRHD